MIYHITWKDAASVDQWTHINEIEPQFHIIETVGMLVKETDEVIVIGLNHDLESDSWACFIHIPKELILAQTELIMAKSEMND